MTNLQDAPLQQGMGLQVAVKSLNGKQIPKHDSINMPIVTKANVQHYWDQMYQNRAAFIPGIAALINNNLASGHCGLQ